jgi:pimeloyl-ACP methyl ester carboxylesterase
LATFVLVHGAFHGGWCWQKLTPFLEASGHSVDAVDLPGHGQDKAPISGVTLEDNAQRVAEHVAAAAEPVVLVGHSMGGMAVTQAAELVPERIARLVYVCAFLPAPGQSLPELANSLPGADNVQPALVVDESAGTATMKTEAIAPVFYGECTDEDAAWAISKLVPESLAAMAAPAAITEERAGSVSRSYVECLRDQAITIQLQRHMHTARPCDPVLHIDADHAPFLSRTRELADHLLSLT